jgi:hypothetical protein
MYVIRTNIHLHVQITYKFFVQIPNIKFTYVRIPNTESSDVDSIWNPTTASLCSESEHPSPSAVKYIWEDQHSTAGSRHLVDNSSVGLASERNKARYTSKMNLITVKASQD